MKKPKQYRVGIVGLSGISARHTLDEGSFGLGAEMPHSHASAYAILPQTEIVGVCDLLEERIDSFIEEWRDTYPQVRGYTDYREMLAKEDLDIISVATSDNRHADIVVDAAESGVRGILCEKPIATTLADADRMIAAVERHHATMTIDHSRRWFPIFRQVKEEVQQGTIGVLRRITLNFGGPRAILFRNGTHMIDTICYLADSDPEWVFAELDDGYEDYWPYQGDGGRNPDLEPGCSGYIHFKNGVRAFYNGSKGLKPRRGFELTGSEGWIWMDDHRAEVGKEEGIRHLPSRPRTHSNTPAVIRDLIRATETGAETISPPREARKTLEVILGFLASQKRGNTRIDFPLDENAV